MRIRFWGTRGSIAKPGPATVRYGGNTACVEVRAADGTLIVLDCGTVPVVLLTALTEADQTEAAFAAGATDYVTKPFRVAHLRSRIEAWLLRPRAVEP